MADSAQTRSGLQIFLQKKASKRLRNTLFTVMPLLELFFALHDGGKDGADGLGRPKMDPGFSAPIVGKGGVKREKIFKEREYLPTIQVSKPDKTEVKKMADYDVDPTVPNWTTTNAPLGRFKQPRFKFSRSKMPYKVPHSEIRTAQDGATTEGQAKAAIRSVYDSEVVTREAVLCEQLNDELWGVNGQPGSPTDEDAVTWDHIHSLEQAINTTGIYGGVDRALAANAWFRGNRIETANTDTFAQRIDHCNYTLGMASKGGGVQCVVVGETQFRKAKAEAKAESFQLMTNGIPEMAEFGFKREVIRIFSGNRPVYILWDPACPAGHGAFLDPSTWTVAIHPDKNFKISTPADQTKVEGGAEADTGTIEVELMLACEVPSFNAYFTNLG